MLIAYLSIANISIPQTIAYVLDGPVFIMITYFVVLSCPFLCIFLKAAEIFIECRSEFEALGLNAIFSNILAVVVAITFAVIMI